jgi:hypothetical protein
MSASKSEPGRLQPSINAEIPAEIEREVRQPHQDRYLTEERRESGGLSDDPTESGEPVKNRRSYANLTGGR